MEINGIQAAIDAGKLLAAHVEVIDGVTCIVTPNGAAPIPAVVALQDKPRRRTGTAQLQSSVSFCDHVNRFKSESSAIFADEKGRQFVGVLNYHPAGAVADPAWGDHRAVYPCPFSPEWATWGAGGERTYDQDAFAKFIDQHDRDLSSGDGYPTPATLVTLAENLEAYSNKSSKRVRKGTAIKLEFVEDAGVKSEVPIPSKFCILIPVFTDSAAALIEVRLRVEIDDGHPKFTIQIHDSPKVIRAAFHDLISNVAGSVQLPIFVGLPE